MGKLTLQILTVFPPTGLIGLNLTAAGMPMAAMAKAAVFGVGALLGVFAKNFYAEFFSKIFTALMILLPPWYIFDCIQILLDSSFEENGFRAPLPIKEMQSGGGKGGVWTLTPSTLSLIMGTITASGYGIVSQFFPNFATGDVGKYTQYAALGGTGLLLVGGLAGSMFSGGSGTPVSAPVDAEQPLQSGGARLFHLPPLSSFASQVGGARKSSEPSPEGVTFLGILGMVVVGGLTLSYLRTLDA